MMKKLIVLALLLAVAGSAQAGTVGTWSGAGTDTLWSNGANWGGTVPATPAGTTGDEIKLQKNNTATVDSTMSYDHNVRLTVGNDTGGIQTIIMTGGALGASELRIGAAKSTTANGIAEMYQSGGTVTANQLLLSRNGSTSVAATSIGNGLYVISGGILQSRGTDGRMYIGAGVNSVTGSNIAQQVGKFVVDGVGGTINMSALYVGGDGTKTGTGAVEFKIGASGVSKISLSSLAMLDGGTGTSTGIADLILTATAPLAASNIVLVETTSATAVAGTFDRLNGVIGAATQGAAVAIGGKTFTLSYLYDATTGVDGAGNDIALIVTPEPTTIAILGFGAFLLRRRKA